ncbi:MAG TPA: hypothetical protein VGN39_11550 [Terriglobales bacterium]|jgi:enterochelin esterase-like enzyme|nr:hypothetical protein [Terriglobales bacterium]
MESYPMQIASNQHMRDVLRAKGYPIGYFEYDGGHAFLNWSGAMTRGLVFLLGDKTAGSSTRGRKVYVNARSR